MSDAHSSARALIGVAFAQDWLLPAPVSAGGTVPVSGTGHERVVPMSVLRYAQRTREPLVVADATGDDRFARDPYFADAGCCSLLALPILSRGTLQAVLLLENRLIRGAFTTERLDAVKLIALSWGQDPDLTQQFLHQTAAMIEDGPWIFPELNAAGWKYNQTYGIVPIPTSLPGQTVTVPLGGETWNIGNSGSAQQQQAAWAQATISSIPKVSGG